jgi:hypothetical protein
MKEEIRYYRATIEDGKPDQRLEDFQDFLKNLTNEKVEAKITDAEYKDYIKKYEDIIKKYK